MIWALLQRVRFKLGNMLKKEADFLKDSVSRFLSFFFFFDNISVFQADTLTK